MSKGSSMRQEIRRIGQNVAEFERKVQVQISNMVGDVNRNLTNFHHRISQAEQATSNLISTDAVALRLVFDRLGITAEERFAAGMELDMFSELFTLFQYFVKISQNESPLFALQEFNLMKVGVNPETEEQYELDNDCGIRVLFLAPADYDNPEENELEGFTLVLKKDGSTGVVDSVVPADLEDFHIVSDVLVSPERFERLFTGSLSFPVAYMEASVSVTDPTGVGRFLQMLNFEEYLEHAQQRMEDAMRAKQIAEQLEAEGGAEIDPELLAETSQHPKEARVFGGNYDGPVEDSLM